MEIKINVINNKILTKLYLKIRVKGKEISYHFLGKSKPQEMINLLITASEYLPDKNSIPIIIKTLRKQFGPPPPHF